MRSPLPPRQTVPQPRTYGFTLVETLMTIAIIAIMMALVMMPLRSLSDQYRINQSTDIILQQLRIAQREAVARGRVTEVRFFQNDGIWTAVQSFFFSPNGLPSASDSILPLQPLSSGVVIDTTSPLIQGAPKSGATMSTHLGSLQWCGVRFSPAGTAGFLVASAPAPPPDEPTPVPILTSSNNYLTIILERDLGSAPSAYASNSGPAQFSAIQINPATGRTTLYKP